MARELEKAKELETYVTPPKRTGPTLEPESTVKRAKTMHTMDKRGDSEDARQHNGDRMWEGSVFVFGVVGSNEIGYRMFMWGW